MNAIVNWIEAIFAAIPLPLLEVWGRFGYVVGFALAIYAFTGFTFRPGGRWRFGRERQAWDAKALLCIPLTFIFIVAAGYVGSFIVLVPGAQTFESLKDLVVFVCILLFGYPALVTVPFAYGLSDLIEGVPPEFLADWLPGYFINPACFWVAYQLFGKNPDFRRARTWSSYLVFVLIFMSMEPVLWGFICSAQFTSEISYRSITPALFFTTTLTWAVAPFAMLGALPLARRFGLFWAEIAGHVKERVLGQGEWIWEAGKGEAPPDARGLEQSLPIRMFILAPFITFVLVMVGATAYVTLRSAENDATKLATRLHQEIAENINLKLDDHLEKSRAAKTEEAIAGLLKDLPISKHGRAFIIDRSGEVIASPVGDNDPVVKGAITNLRKAFGRLENIDSEFQFSFDHVSAKPLSRETWLAQATAYQDKSGDHVGWIVLTAMPEAYYLAGVRTGNSRSAMVFALALLLSLAVAAFQASMVTAPLRRISRATRALARGNLAQRVPRSRLEELDALARSFNGMTEQLKRSFDDLLNEVETRKRLEEELRATQAGLERRVAERTRTLAETTTFLDALVDHMPNPVFYKDSELRYAGCNRAYEEAFGVKRADLVGKTVLELEYLPETDRRRYQEEQVRLLTTAGSLRREASIRLADGKIHQTLFSVSAFRRADESPGGLVGVLVDITALKETQAALAEAKHAAEAADRLKSAFLATMSHELRTPLNSIIGFTGLVLQELPGPLNDEQKKQLGMVLDSARHLLALINDVLDISKIEVGELAVAAKPFDLATSIKKVAGIVGPLAAKKGLTLRMVGGEGIGEIVGDARRVEQILLNLLGNAIKFTEAGSVSLSVGPDVENIAWQGAAPRPAVRIAVTDTGIGIKPEDMTQLFQPFRQIDSTLSRNHEGTGLGLAICRRLAALMGGEITAESRWGKGSAFTLTLPLRPHSEKGAT